MMGIAMRIPVLAGGLALLAAALLLAPGAARAQQNTCGVLNAGNMFTANCPNAAYTTGILYGERGNAITLTVPGTATTATVTAAAQALSFHNGISVTTTTHASDARNIDLTVGGTGTFVAIVQGSSPHSTNNWFRNTGIVVQQATPNGSTTTVDVKSGVTIGTATTKMANRGIYVRTQPANTGAGAVSVTSGATIHSVRDGIVVQNSAASAVTVTNSGDITSESTWRDEGIFARTTGKDADGDDAGVTITHSAGAIAVAMGGVGIKAHVGMVRSEGDTMGGTYVTPENIGLAKVAVTGGLVTSRESAV